MNPSVVVGPLEFLGEPFDPCRGWQGVESFSMLDDRPTQGMEIGHRSAVQVPAPPTLVDATAREFREFDDQCAALRVGATPTNGWSA